MLISVDLNRLDAVAANAVKARISELIDDSTKKLIVDFQSVEFIDSSGLGTFVSILKRLVSKNKVMLCNLQPNVANTFKLTRMDRVFEIYHSRDDAISSVA